MLRLSDGDVNCEDCEGKGFLGPFYNKKRKKYYIPRCKRCSGTGSVNWLDNIFKNPKRVFKCE